MSNQTVTIVSFPRSGQHMNTRMLEHFHKKNNIPYTYCDFYNCCKQLGCKYNATYQKNHDFNLDLPIDLNKKYIFLYRKDKIEQIEAYYRYANKNSQISPYISSPDIDLNKNEDYNNFINFYKTRSDYYDQMISKYVNTSNILCIDYNDYITNHVETFYTIIKFIGFDVTQQDIIDCLSDYPEKIKKQHIMDANIKIIKDVNYNLNA